MIYRHTEEEMQYYFSAPALNQSAIKVIIRDGIQKFSELEEQLVTQEDLYYEEKQHFTIGSAVDHIITLGMDSFNSRYAYSTLTNKPPDTVMSIVKKVFDEIPLLEEKVGDIRFYAEQLYHSCNDHSYYMNRKIPSDKLVKGKIDERTWKDDKRVEGFLGDGTVAKYWEELISSQGKQLLSEFEKEKILGISNSLLNHPHTKRLFEDSKDIDIIYQMPLFFQRGGVLCKAMIDMIRIDHIRKKILHIDIKTMGDYVLRFNISLRARRYDVQGSFYSIAIKSALEEISKLIGKDVTKYSVSNPAFIVESTIKPGTPMIYVMTEDLMQVGVQGDKYLLGYSQGIQLYREWKDLNYSLDQRFKYTNGVIWIDSQFTYNEIF